MLQERATVPESIREAPPEVRTVYSTLAFNGPLTRREVGRHALLAPAEIPRWIIHLVHAGLVTRDPDCETVRYDVVEG